MAPPNMKYAKSHEWIQPDGDTGVVGISEFATRQLTDLVYLELPKVGRKLKAGEVFGVIESVKSANDLYAPVAGEVVAVNTSLPNDLATLSSDPFGKGWLIKLKLSQPAELNSLMDDAAYSAHCESEQH